MKKLNLNKVKLNYLYNTKNCKIIRFELPIKHWKLEMSGTTEEWNEEITLYWNLPTSYEDYELYPDWEDCIDIELLKNYQLAWILSDKYTQTITLIKDEKKK